MNAPILGAPGDSVRYEVGNAGFRGRTIVEVAGDGSVRASFQRGAATDNYRATLSAAELDGLRTLLRDNDVGSLRSARSTGQPDEDRVRIALVTGGQSTEAELWYGEQWTNPGLRALIGAFGGLAARASGGRIPY